MHQIPSEILQEILNYLATKPYTEVYRLIKAIVENSKEVEEVLGE